jgi:hypothetical protein
LKTKDKDNNKKLIYILQPGTIADSKLQPITIPSASLLPSLHVTYKKTVEAVKKVVK